MGIEGTQTMIPAPQRLANLREERRRLRLPDQDDKMFIFMCLADLTLGEGAKDGVTPAELADIFGMPREDVSRYISEPSNLPTLNGNLSYSLNARGVRVVKLITQQFHKPRKERVI
jgi:hypothetical protein